MSPETPTTATLSDDELARIDAYWRAANYLSVGQIYLLDNPLLAKPLSAEHVKPRLLGHWGTTPGLNLVYAHLNRVIRNRDANVIYVTGPGTAVPAWSPTPTSKAPTARCTPASGRRRRIAAAVSAVLLSRWYPQPCRGPDPGSIHEGGELGYALVHAFGAAFDNPDLVVACVIGDGEAETGPLAASWHSNKFLNPAIDGAVLPILHLNGYKIANPTVLARIPHDELASLLRGYGYRPIAVSGDDPLRVHRQLAGALDDAFDDIAAIQHAARSGENSARPVWPMIVLRTPKGWTGPKVVDGMKVEGTWRSHQVPLADTHDSAERRRQLEEWLRSYRPMSSSTTTARCGPSCGRWHLPVIGG
ncbi:XFP N-terminal domain protein [Mycobacterium kansasii]|uniref:XFP N-terminal domain protein n=1 Tax=Mycobacterium kansasii TaxID=1768 RepID=A0A1V3X4B0_MYCKA|nr:XFP N-terminal domain protein [Mycobacterium kansasii]